MLTIEHQESLSTVEGRVELIEQLLEIGAALSDANDLGQLLELILCKSREITCSDAGSVYLVDASDNTPKLIFKAAQNDSKPNLSFNEFAIPLTRKSLAGYVALTGETLNLPDAYNLMPGVPYKLDTSFDRDFDYLTRSVLVLPMQNRQKETIGVIQLINRKKKQDLALSRDNTWMETQPYSEWEERIIKSLASQAAISIERNNLQDSIENLFEGFVKASVQVIEARDPTTSGHSERVAELTLRLAMEANNVSQGPLSAIHFNDRQIQEIRYASLLHDVGKIGVPEAILSKQKKLYPEQLDVIRHRFALAQRTLEMECAQSKYRYLVEHPSYQHGDHNQEHCPHCHFVKESEAQLSESIAQLADYWHILLAANNPQVMAEEPLAQLQELSKYTYRDIDGEIKHLITPEEMAQLMVSRGSLTIKERLSIEAHVTYSYEFLKRIPWTQGLKNVPEIAYGHHEKLDGTGYPRGLTKAELPIQTQMMIITDIYDALTAGDRPYKRGLPVETTLKILRQEAAQNKINGDFVELFEQRQVYSFLGHSLQLH